MSAWRCARGDEVVVMTPTSTAGRAGVLAPRSRFYYKIGGKSMGKRELLIIAAFVVVGVVAYQFTAPPPKEGERGILVSARSSQNIKREVTADSASATRHADGHDRAAGPSVNGAPASAPSAVVPLTVVGEAPQRHRLRAAGRVDAALTTRRRASTPERSKLREDDLGAALGHADHVSAAKARRRPS